ncbi:substrate-binding periplasmic protein [Leeia oryzae]|uniref:substrate-binding periplasmic protein n=1 Tax=Leeia oryzae TaxID=356662 RepID=UPI0003780F33|nr:transporter substrate-binding domain-containing protein [Leeia oryzae]
MKKSLVISGFVLSSVLWASVAHALPLRVMYGRADYVPFAEFADKNSPEKLTGGIVYDLANLLAGELQVDVKFVESSRKRVEFTLLSGNVDIACNTNPAWMAQSGRYGWTQPIFAHEEVIVTLAAEDFKPDTLAELKGKRLGTILGYFYPELQNAFAHDVKRMDEPTLDSNFRKLQLHLIDALITTRDEFFARLKLKPAERLAYRMSDFKVSESTAYCTVSPLSRFSVAQINQAIDRLKQSGKWTDLLSKYDLAPVESMRK